MSDPTPTPATTPGSTGVFRIVVMIIGGVVALVTLCAALVFFGRSGTPEVTVTLDPQRVADPGHGQKIYMTSCATCHGPAGRGLPHQGAPLAGSRFLQANAEIDVIRMVKAGRTPQDPQSVMRLPMPPKGGYGGLSDADLQDVTAYIRTFSNKTAQQALAR